MIVICELLLEAAAVPEIGNLHEGQTLICYTELDM